ncbi:MAG: N-acetylmuramoyl-L-alanine amidase [Pikeienuella sp.]
MRPINEIIVHCTATRPEWWKSRTTNQKVAEVRKWHLDRGWSDIGYHFLIDRNGNVAKGRPVSREGAHVRGHNKGTIGVSLFGGHGSSETDDFSDNFTPEQDAALLTLLDDLKAKYGISRITGHNQYAAKACPGFDVPDWLSAAPQLPPDVEPSANEPNAPVGGFWAVLWAILGRK